MQNEILKNDNDWLKKRLKIIIWLQCLWIAATIAAGIYRHLSKENRHDDGSQDTEYPNQNDKSCLSLECYSVFSLYGEPNIKSRVIHRVGLCE